MSSGNDTDVPVPEQPHELLLAQATRRVPGCENASQLLHNANGELVRVLQDGGNPNQTVWDWGQAETKGKFLALADRAVGSGITSFFLDKASVSTHNTSEHGRQICVDNQPLRHCSATVSEAVGDAWDAGHKQVVL